MQLRMRYKRMQAPFVPRSRYSYFTTYCKDYVRAPLSFSSDQRAYGKAVCVQTFARADKTAAKLTDLKQCTIDM